VQEDSNITLTFDYQNEQNLSVGDKIRFLLKDADKFYEKNIYSLTENNITVQLSQNEMIENCS